MAPAAVNSAAMVSYGTWVGNVSSVEWELLKQGKPLETAS